MFDAILFEKAGVPAAAIITTPFNPTARAVAELHGMDDLAYAQVAHPITSLTIDEVRDRARVAAPLVEAILLGL
ncbi:MAG: hypothetical protein AAF567_04660 [Actinomycetota bacterium]